MGVSVGQVCGWSVQHWPVRYSQWDEGHPLPGVGRTRGRWRVRTKHPMSRRFIMKIFPSQFFPNILPFCHEMGKHNTNSERCSKNGFSKTLRNTILIHSFEPSVPNFFPKYNNLRYFQKRPFLQKIMVRQSWWRAEALWSRWIYNELKSFSVWRRRT